MSKVEGRAKAGQAPQVSRKCVSGGGDQAPRVALPGDDPDVRHLAALADDRAAGERVLGPWRPQEVDRDVDDPRHNRDVGLDQKLHHRGVFEQRADDAAVDGADHEVADVALAEAQDRQQSVAGTATRPTGQRRDGAWRQRRLELRPEAGARYLKIPQRRCRVETCRSFTPV